MQHGKTNAHGTNKLAHRGFRIDHAQMLGATSPELTVTKIRLHRGFRIGHAHKRWGETLHWLTQDEIPVPR